VNLPTAEETKQIKKEKESLPSIEWLINYDDSFPVAIQNTYRMGDSTLLAAALQSQRFSEEVILPPATKKADEGSK